MRVFRQKYTDRAGKTRESSKWYVELTDHLERPQRFAGFTDKGATIELGRWIKRLVETRMSGGVPSPDLSRWLETVPRLLRERFVKVGLLDSKRVASNKPLSEHVGDFVASLRAVGRTKDYIEPVECRIRRIITDCGFQSIGDIQGSAVQECLAKLKTFGSKPRKADDTNSKPVGLGQRTVNHYLAAMKQFTRWLVTDRRAHENALAHLQAGNANLDIRRERRELSETELQELLKSAETGPTLFGITGENRRRLYVVAISTGLRASECASLTPRHFDLNSDPPTVRIDAADEKSRRGDVLPIPSDLVAMLRPWLATIGPDEPLWPGDWAAKRRGSKMMMADLARAGIAYRDDDGQQADFHALRHTFLSRLGRSGASPKAMATSGTPHDRTTHSGTLHTRELVRPRIGRGQAAADLHIVTRTRSRGTEGNGYGRRSPKCLTGLLTGIGRETEHRVALPCLITRSTRAFARSHQSRTNVSERILQIMQISRRKRNFRDENQSTCW